MPCSRLATARCRAALAARLALAAAALLAAAAAAAQPAPSTSVARRIELDRKPVSATVLRSAEPARTAAVAERTVELRRGEVLFTKLSDTAEARRPVTAAPVRPPPRAEPHPPPPPAPGEAAPPPDREPRASAWALPYEARFLDASGALRTARLVAEVVGGGLQLSPDGSEFRGDVFVMFEDREEPGRRHALPSAVQILVVAPVRADPQLVTLATTAEWQPVRLQAAAPPDAFRVKLRPPFDPEGVEVTVSTLRPLLRVDVTPPRIQGLGLETAVVTVSADGLPRPAGRHVTLLAAGGRLASTEVVLDEAGFARTELRSVALGPVTVRARGPQLADAISAPAWFAFPWGFLVAALLGGATGALVRRWRGARGRGRAPALARDLAAGVLSALVAAVLYAIGVNVLPVQPTATAGEALVFGVGAVGALLGPGLLGRVQPGPPPHPQT